MSQPTSHAPSRAHSQDRGDGPIQQRQPSRRGRSRSRRSPSVTSTISDGGSEEAPQGKGGRRRNQGNRRRGGGLPALDEVGDVGKQVGNAVNAVGDTVGNTVGGAVDAVGGATDAVGGVVGAVGGGGGDKPLKLRLDLNLDADIRLTAKVHGDVTLTLL